MDETFECLWIIAIYNFNLLVTKMEIMRKKQTKKGDLDDAQEIIVFWTYSVNTCI